MAPSNKHHLRSKIQALHNDGCSINQIIDKLKVARNTVRKWIRKADGDVEDKNRTGRPVKMTPNSKATVRRLAKGTGTGLRRVTKVLNMGEDYKNRDKSVCVSTVRNFVRKTEWGKTAYKVRVRPMISKKNVDDRKAFCERMVKEGFCDDSGLGKINIVYRRITCRAAS